MVIINFLCLGSSHAGKSSLIRALHGGTDAAPRRRRPASASVVSELFQTDLLVRHMRVGGREVRVHLWDTLGMEHVTRELAMTYVRTADVLLLCFDVTDRQSFEDIPLYHDFALEARRRSSAAASVHLVATKIDRARQRRVALDEARELSREMGSQLFETTTNVAGAARLAEAFHSMVRDAVIAKLAGDHALSDAAENPQPPIRLDFFDAHEAPPPSSCFGGAAKPRPEEAGKAGVSAGKLVDALSSKWVEVHALQLATGHLGHLNGTNGEARAARRDLASVGVAGAGELAEPGPGETRCPLACGAVLADNALRIVAHVEIECDMRRVRCPLQCGSKPKLRFSDEHVRRHCPNRVRLCTTCCALVAEGDFEAHQRKYRGMPLELWAAGDAAHFANDAFGIDAAHALADAAGAPVTGKSLMQDLPRLVPAVSQDDVRAKLPRSPQQSSSSPTSQASQSKSTSAQRQKSPSPSPTLSLNFKEQEQKQEHNSLHSPHARNSLLAGLAGFDKSKLSKAKVEGAVETAANGASASQSEEQGHGQGAQRQRHAGNPLLAGLAGFDRSKLRSTESGASGEGKPSNANHAHASNPLLAGLAGFDRSTLRKPRSASVPPKPRPNGASPMFASLAHAIEQRRLVIESQEDDEPSSSSGWLSSS